MRILATMGAMLLTATAHAQVASAAAGPESARPSAPAGWSITVGVAPVLSPAWQGSRDMNLSLFPDLRVNYGDILFASVPDGIGWNAINEGGWRAGPLAKIRFGRDENEGSSPFLIAGGSEALVGMGNVKAAGEVGGFVEKSLGRRREWRVRGEVRHGFGGHQGMVADASINYRIRVGRSSVSFGPRTTAASADFMQTYFGVDAGQSLRTGLAPYRADGGILSYGIGGTVVRPLDRRSVLTLFTSFERLGGPPAQSSLIRERGQRNQFTLGLGYGFRFGL